MAITIKNNFSAFKSAFKTDTGLEYNQQNIGLYIQYYNARMNDEAAQVVTGLTNQILNDINFLPNKMRLEFADMLRTHEVIKELLKNKP
jgi:hypothetical protein